MKKIIFIEACNVDGVFYGVDQVIAVDDELASVLLGKGIAMPADTATVFGVHIPPENPTPTP